MNICYVITQSDSIGGASIHVRDIATAMREKGHNVITLVGGNGPFVAMLRERGIPVASIPHLVREISPSKDLRAFQELLKAFRQFRPDLISAHSSKAGILARLAGKKVGIPVIFTAHGFAFTEGVSRPKRLAYKYIERFCAPLADKIIAVSEYDRQLALKERICNSDKIVTIHNGIPDISESLRADPGREPPRIIMVARFEEQKDHLLLLHALSQLRTLPWKLELVGDGPLRMRCEDFVRKNNMTDTVEFSGTCSDIPERLSRAQIFVLTSKWEGLPLTIIEAMRAGLPVIASDVGGVRELVKEEISGYLISKSNPEFLKNKIWHLLSISEKRQKMGLEGRSLYDKFFCLEKMIKKNIKIYKNLVIYKK